MKKMMLSLSVIFLLFSSSSNLLSQELKVIHFDEFEEMLSRQNDTVYVYNFWATWCIPCVKEMPYFQQLSKEYAPEKLKIVFVSLDFPDQLARVKAFVQKKEIQEEVFLLDEVDANSWINKVSEDWSGAIPATLAVQSSQDVRTLKEGSFTYDSLNSWLNQFVASN